MSILCCLRSRDEKDKGDLEKCNDATLNRFYRKRAFLLDYYNNPTKYGTSVPICEHWSISRMTPDGWMKKDLYTLWQRKGKVGHLQFL